MAASVIESEKENLSIGLPPRRETILARYSRNFKMGVAGVLLAVVVLPWLVKLPASWTAKKNDERHLAKIESADDNKIAGVMLPSDTSKNLMQTHTTAAGDIINDQDDHSIKLVPAPVNGLTEDTAEGSLPRISEDGRQPWQIYARPFNTADKRPRIGVVVVDLGLARGATDAAISRLPTNVTLAFDVQSPVVGAWCARARQDGHETLLMVPMEPFDYPRSDPGPNTLLTNLPNSDNLGRLLWALRQSTGYVGITTLSGSRFTTDPDKLTPVLDTLHNRGLMIFDARVAPHSVIMDMATRTHVAATAGTVRIDQDLAPDAIDAALDQLEKTARLTGHAVGITASSPVVIDRLQAWTKDLPAHGISLAPISAMIQ
jgi:hypothetical protein